MTRPAEGVAAERMAEVRVGTPAVTSGAAFVENMSASRLWKVSEVESPEQDCHYRFAPARRCCCFRQRRRYKALLWLASSRFLSSRQMGVLYRTNETRRSWKGIETTNALRSSVLKATTNSAGQTGRPKGGRVGMMASLTCH